MTTLSEILHAARTGGEVGEDDLRRAVVALSTLESLTAGQFRLLRAHPTPEAFRVETLERSKRLKRALDRDPKYWLGPDNDPLDPDVQERHRRLAEAVGAWFDREDR